MARVTLEINLPDNVSEEELAHFLNFKFLGHGGDGDVLSKFQYEELDVEDYKIEMNV